MTKIVKRLNESIRNSDNDIVRSCILDGAAMQSDNLVPSLSRPPEQHLERISKNEAWNLQQKPFAWRDQMVISLSMKVKREYLMSLFPL